MREFNKADHWDSAADRYEKTAHPYTARYVEAALARVPLTPASRVLDIAAGTGALAEQVLLNAAGTALRPDVVSAEQAASLPVSVCTAFDALDELDLPEGATLVVLGAGGGCDPLAVDDVANSGCCHCGVPLVSGPGGQASPVTWSEVMPWKPRLLFQLFSCGGTCSSGHLR